MVNSLSIIKISQIILKNSKPQIILNLSSDAGSISLNKSGDAYIYRTSKSALNSITKNMSIDLKKKYGTTVLAIDPGNVQSGMNSKGYMESDKSTNFEELENFASIKHSFFPGRIKCFKGILVPPNKTFKESSICLLYTSDAADE